MTTRTKSKCEHLNVETKKMAGILMAVCRDCFQTVDPKEFEVSEALKAESNGELSTYKKVLQLEVDSLIDTKAKDCPAFFPIFAAKPGDLIVLLRKR